METDPLIGRVIGGGRYELVSRLGQGGMGQVYAAWQREVGRQVVVKLIHGHLVSDPDLVQRMRQEMQLTAKVEHPNTIRLYDFAEENGQLFLVMEFLKGQTLGAMLHAEGRMSPARIARLGVQIARGLRAIHAAGVVHRDLKPDNVMVVNSELESDQVKILDFGIARPLAAEAGKMTLAGRLIGTPLYMSPEQIGGRTLDARSDLYTLGVVLYEMAAGAPPFPGDTPALLMMAHMQNEPPSVTFAGGESPQLSSLIMRLLAKTPESRPATAAEVVYELERILTASAGPTTGLTGTHVALKSEPALVPLMPVSSTFPVPLPAQAPGPSSPLDVKPRRRRLPPVLAFAAVVVVAVAAAAVVVRLQRREPPTPTSAVEENNRGNTLQREGSLKEAEAAYRRALLLAPGYLSPRFNLGLLALRRGDAVEAIGAFDAIAREQPDHPGVFLARAEAHRQLGQRDQAQGDLEEHVRRHPQDAEGWVHLGRILQATHADQAKEAFCRARDLGSAEGAKGCPP